VCWFVDVDDLYETVLAETFVVVGLGFFFSGGGREGGERVEGMKSSF